MERQLAVKIPGCPPGSLPSLFGFNKSAAFLAAGNANGDVYVFDAQSGERMAHMKVRQTIREGDPNGWSTMLVIALGS